MDMLRIAVIGTGFMGKAHALAFNAVGPTFAEGPAPLLDTVCDSDLNSALRAAGQFSFRRALTDWREVVADPTIDAVSIATPNGTHREIAVAALAAGKHVWCEKPMGLSPDDAVAMADAAHSSGRIALLGYNYLRNPALAHAERLIEAGAIGKVFDFRGQFDEDYFADPHLPWSWRMSRTEAGLGVLGDLMCHLLSIALMLVGRVERVMGVSASVHATRTGERGSRDVENEDLAHALVQFEGGAKGVLGSSRVAHGRKNGIRIEIHGTGGMIVYDQERLNELHLFQAAGPIETRGFRTILTGPQHPPYDKLCPAPGHQLGFNDLKLIEARHFLRCIRGEEIPFLSFDDGVAIERAIHGIARSATEGRWVDVL